MLYKGLDNTGLRQKPPCHTCIGRTFRSDHTDDKAGNILLKKKIHQLGKTKLFVTGRVTPTLEVTDGTVQKNLSIHLF